MLCVCVWMCFLSIHLSVAHGLEFFKNEWILWITLHSVLSLLLVSMTECLTFTFCVRKSKLIETLINYTQTVCVAMVVTSHGWVRVVRDLIQWKIQTDKVAFEQWQWGDGFNRSLVLSLFCSNQQLALWLPQNIACCVMHSSSSQLNGLLFCGFSHNFESNK